MFIQKFVTQEIAYFKKLNADGQKLLSSILLYSLVSPLFNIFLNAFLWRQSQDVLLVAFFNLVVFCFIPFAFYINGWLLKRFSPGRLYFLSLFINGLAIASLIFLKEITYFITFIFGIVTGITAGMYWANRNLLTLKTTQSDNRIYFSSLETSSGTLTNVIVPLFIGWFITLGVFIHLYSPVQGYQMISIIMLITITFIGLVVKNLSIKSQNVGRLLLPNISSAWRKFQIMQFIWGLNNGITTFIAALLILILVGQEETLGTVQSITAILTGLLVFALAKYLDVRHRLALILASAVILTIGAFIFGIVYSAIGVFILVACQSLASSFEWIAFTSLNYDLIEKDSTNKKHHYAYVCDQEIYLNGGRVIAILLFIGMIYFGSQELALRFSPLIVGFLQIFAYFFAKSIDQSPMKT